MTANGQNFEIYQGDNKTIIIPITDKDTGNIVTLSGYDAVFCVYRQTLENVIFHKTTLAGEGITIPNPDSGELVIALDQVDTANLTPRNYGFQCEISDSSGNHSTVTTGYIKVLRSLTHSLF